MTRSLLLFAFWVSALCGVHVQVLGRVMDHCEVASKLLKLGARRDQVSTWVCIAMRESRYDTAAVGPPNWDGSRDHGIFQINDRYWCSPSGKGCGVPCTTLVTDNIKPSWKCAKTVYKETERLSGNGFTAWATYNPYCADDTSSYIAGCNL